MLSGKLKISNVGKKDMGTYICKAKNILRSARDSVQLMIVSRLRFKVRPPQEVTPGWFGSTVRLPCVAESDLKTTIMWTKDGETSLPVDSTVLRNDRHTDYSLFVTSSSHSWELTPVKPLIY